MDKFSISKIQKKYLGRRASQKSKIDKKRDKNFFFSSISYVAYFFQTVLKARFCGFCSPQMCNTNLHTQCETNMLHKKCKKKTIFQWGFCRFCIVTSSLPEFFFLNLRNWKFFNANLLQFFAISTCTVWTKYTS